MTRYKGSHHRYQNSKRENCLNDSGEFQEVESNYSGKISHVPCQPAVILSPRSILRCDERLPLDTWNLSRSQENVFGNPRFMFESSQTPYHGILHSTTPSATGAVPVHVCAGTPVARGEELIGSTIPMPTRRPWIPFCQWIFGQQRQQISELEIDKLLHSTINFLWRKIRFRSQVTTCSGSFVGGHVMDPRSGDGRFSGWIFYPRDQLQARNSQLLNCWTRGLLLLWTRSSRTLTSRIRSVSRNWKPRKRTGRQIAFITGDWRSWYRINSSCDNVQEFDTRWEENFIVDTKIPSDDVLESLYKLRIWESDQLKTVLELYCMEIHQKISMLNFQKLRTMVKRGKDQKLRLRNFDARHRKIIETGAVVKSRRV